jgi:hypothetical protein
LVLAISVRSSSARLLGNDRSSVSVEDTARSSFDAVLACVCGGGDEIWAVRCMRG